MAFENGCIISGKYAGGIITLKSSDILDDIKTVEFIETVNDPFTDFNGIQRFAQKYIVRVTYYSGGESLVKATPEFSPHLESCAKRNAHWRSLTPQQQQEEIKRQEKEDSEKNLFFGKFATVFWIIITVLGMIYFVYYGISEYEVALGLCLAFGVMLPIGFFGWLLSLIIWGESSKK